MTIYLDFDGTVVEHQYPKMGRENFGCMEVIKKLQDAGHEIIINTYRADMGAEELQKAYDYVNWHPKVDLEYGTKISPKKIPPPEWDLERQIIEEAIFIDDHASGIPLKPTVMVENGRMVDWGALDIQFKEHGLY
jgi:hypothetical protein